jgi:hypothetical protein
MFWPLKEIMLTKWFISIFDIVSFDVPTPSQKIMTVEMNWNANQLTQTLPFYNVTHVMFNIVKHQMFQVFPKLMKKSKCVSLKQTNKLTNILHQALLSLNFWSHFYLWLSNNSSVCPTVLTFALKTFELKTPPTSR